MVILLLLLGEYGHRGDDLQRAEGKDAADGEPDPPLQRGAPEVDDREHAVYDICDGDDGGVGVGDAVDDGDWQALRARDLELETTKNVSERVERWRGLRGDGGRRTAKF